MGDLITAFGLMLVFEGVVYALFPGGMKRAMAQIQTLPDAILRNSGLAVLVAGVVIVWFVRG